MTEEQKNNTENCDQFTKPEEISALKKYLRALKEELDERTELGTESQMMDPSYREEKAHLDTSRENLTIGENPLLNLPGTKETIDVEKLSRLDQMRVRLEGTNDNLESLNSSLDKIHFIGEEESLADELIKISGNKEPNSLSDKVEKLEGNKEESQRLSNTVERLENTSEETTLSKNVEKLNKEDSLGNLSNSLEKLTNTKESDSLSNSVEKLKLSGEENILSNEVDRISGEREDIILANELDKIGGVKEKTILSSEVDKLKNPLEDIDLDNSREKLEVADENESLGKNLERVHDPFKKPEKLNNSLETADVKPSGKVDLSSYLDKIINPKEESSKLSDDLERIENNIGTSLSNLPQDKEFIENPPKEQTLGRRILNKIRGVEKIDKLSGDKEIVRGTIQKKTELGTTLESPINFTQKDEIGDLSKVVDTIDIPKENVSLGEERQEIPFRGNGSGETLSSHLETIKASKESSLEEVKEIIPGDSVEVTDLDHGLDTSGKLSNSSIDELDKELDKISPKVESSSSLDDYVDSLIGEQINPSLSTTLDPLTGEKILNTDLGNYRENLKNANSDLELGKERIDYVVDNTEKELGNFVDTLNLSNTDNTNLGNTVDKLNISENEVVLGNTLDKANISPEDVSLGDTLEKLNTNQEDILLDKTLDKIDTDSEDISLDNILDKINTSQEDIALDNTLDKIDTDLGDVLLDSTLDKINTDSKEVSLDKTLDKIDTDLGDVSLGDTLDKINVGEETTELGKILENISNPNDNAVSSLPEDLMDEEKLHHVGENLFLSEELDKISVSEDNTNLSDYLDTISPSDVLEELRKDLPDDGFSISDQDSQTEQKISLEEDGLLYEFLEDGYMIYDQESNTSQKIFYSEEGLRKYLEEEGFILADQDIQSEEKIYLNENGLAYILQDDGYVIRDQNSDTEQKIYYLDSGLRKSLEKDGYTIDDQEPESSIKTDLYRDILRSTLEYPDGYSIGDQILSTEQKLFLQNVGLRKFLEEDGISLRDQNSNTEQKIFYTEEGLRYELQEDGYVIYDQNTGTEQKIYYSEIGLRKDLEEDGIVLSDQETSNEKVFFTKDGLRYELQEDGYTIYDQNTGTEQKIYYQNSGLRDSLDDDNRSINDQDPNTLEKLFFNYTGRFHDKGLRKVLPDDGHIRKDQTYNTEEKAYLEDENKGGLTHELNELGKSIEDQEPKTQEKKKLKQEGLREVLSSQEKPLKDQEETKQKEFLSEKGLSQFLEEIEEDDFQSEEKLYLNDNGLNDKGLRRDLSKDGKIGEDEISSLEKFLLDDKGLTRSLKEDERVEKDQLKSTEKEQLRDSLPVDLSEDSILSPDQRPETDSKKFLNYEGELKDRGLVSKLEKEGKTVEDFNKTEEKYNIKIGNLPEELTKEEKSIIDQNNSKEREKLDNNQLESRLSRDNFIIKDQNSRTDQKELLDDSELPKKLSSSEKILEDQTKKNRQKFDLEQYGLNSTLEESEHPIKDQNLDTSGKNKLSRDEIDQKISQDGYIREDQSGTSKIRLDLGSGLLRDELETTGKIIKDQTPDTEEKAFLNYEGRYHDRGLRKELSPEGKIIKDQDPNTDEKFRLNNENWGKGLKDTIDPLGQIISDQDSKTLEKDRLRREGLEETLTSQGIPLDDQNFETKEKFFLNQSGLRKDLTLDGIPIDDQNADTELKAKLKAGELRNQLDFDGKSIEDQNSNTKQKAYIEEHGLRDSIEEEGFVLEDQSKLSSIKEDLNSGRLRDQLELDGRSLGDQNPDTDIKDDLYNNKLRSELALDGKVLEDQSNVSSIKEDLNSGKLRDQLELDGKSIEDQTNSEIKDDLSSGILRETLEEDGHVEKDKVTSPIKEDLNAGVLRDYLESMGLTQRTEGPPRPNIDELAVILDDFIRDSGDISDEALKQLFDDLLHNRALRDFEHTEEDRNQSLIRQLVKNGWRYEELPDDGYVEEDKTTSPIKEDLNKNILRNSLDPDGGIISEISSPEGTNLSQIAVILHSFVKGDYGELSEAALKSLFDFLLDLRGKANLERIRTDQVTSSIKDDLQRDVLRDSLERDGIAKRTIGPEKPSIDPITVLFDDYKRDASGMSPEELAWKIQERAEQYMQEEGLTNETVGPDKSGISQLAVIFDNLIRNKYGELGEDSLKSFYDFFIDLRAKANKERSIEDQIRYGIDGTIGKQFDPDREPLPDAVLGIRTGQVFDNDGNILDDPDKIKILSEFLEKLREDQVEKTVDLASYLDKIGESQFSETGETDPLAIFLLSLLNMRNLPTTSIKDLWDQLKEFQEARKQTTREDQLPNEEIKLDLNNEEKGLRNYLEEDGHIGKDLDSNPKKNYLESLTKGRNGQVDETADPSISNGFYGKETIEKAPEFTGTSNAPVDSFAKDLHNSSVDKSNKPEDEELLRQTLDARARHDFQSYAAYLINFAESKQFYIHGERKGGSLVLSPNGWASKLSGILSCLSGKDVNTDTIKWAEEEIKKAAREYYESDEGKIVIGYSDFPRNSIEAMLNVNSYIRYLADQVRRGYNNLTTEGGHFWAVLDGITGLKEELADKVFFLLLKLRDKFEKATKSQPHRLPGNGTALSNSFGKGLDGLLGDFAAGYAENLATNLETMQGGVERVSADEWYADKSRAVIKPNRNRPLNRPEGEITVENVSGGEPSVAIQVEEDFSSRSLTYNTKEKKTWRDVEGWINPNEAAISELNNFHEVIDNDYESYDGELRIPDNSEPQDINWSGVNRRALKQALTGKGGTETLPNYIFNREYIQGTGMYATLHDLTGLDPTKVLTPRDLQKGIASSPFMTHPTKFTKAKSIFTDNGEDSLAGFNSPWTLDTDAYWEVVIEPYLGIDNGFRSYLPCIEEINAINWIQHNVVTNFERWFPVLAFDLSKSKLTSKSLGIYGGEINFPGGIEFTNELRLTLLDNSYKSFRKYFEKCMNVSVYNSEIHGPEFYGYNSSTGEFLGPRITQSNYYFTEKNLKRDPNGYGGMYDLPGEAIFYKDETGKEKLFRYVGNTVSSFCRNRNLPSHYFISAVDKTSICLALYKNVTFRIRIYIMTPQYGTIDKYDLLCVLKEMSEERKGEVESGGSDLELQFSVVGENPNPRWGNPDREVKEDSPYYPTPKKEDKKPEAEKKPAQKRQQKKDKPKENNQAKPKHSSHHSSSSKPKSSGNSQPVTAQNRGAGRGTGTATVNNNYNTNNNRKGRPVGVRK